MPDTLRVQSFRRTLISLDECDKRQPNPLIFIALGTLPVDTGCQSLLLAHLRRFHPQSIKRDEHGLYVIFDNTYNGRESGAKCYRSITDLPRHGPKLIVKYRENGFSLRERLQRCDQKVPEMSSMPNNHLVSSPPRDLQPISSVGMDTANRMDLLDFPRDPSHMSLAKPDEIVYAHARHDCFQPKLNQIQLRSSSLPPVNSIKTTDSSRIDSAIRSRRRLQINSFSDQLWAAKSDDDKSFQSDLTASDILSTASDILSTTSLPEARKCWECSGTEMPLLNAMIGCATCRRKFHAFCHKPQITNQEHK